MKALPTCGCFPTGGPWYFFDGSPRVSKMSSVSPNSITVTCVLGVWPWSLLA